MELRTIHPSRDSEDLLGILTAVNLRFNEVIKRLESIDRSLRSRDA